MCHAGFQDGFSLADWLALDVETIPEPITEAQSILGSDWPDLNPMPTTSITYME